MYLYHPPPIACVHLIIDAAPGLVTCILSLWGEHQMFRKFRIAVKSPNTLHNVPAIEFELFISDLELLELERGPAGQFAVNDVIEFVDRLK
jgi:hypothetical protein